jgi:hypothetical protein
MYAVSSQWRRQAQKSRRKKPNADKDIKLRAKVYVKHTVTMYDQHDCCNLDT